ncbi:MAG TPA: V4R domain-containing protein [Anaerolineae bacterium]|nr:V4R domain-containing protein [Anaerolineae bacterium]
MEITLRPGQDAVANIPLADGYLYFALKAIEEVAGEKGLNIVLRNAGLERFIGNYPSRDLKFSDLTYRDYALLNKAIADFYGRAAKGFAVRIGRASARYSIEDQDRLFGMASLALKLLPTATQQRLGFQQIVNGFKTLYREINYDIQVRFEETPVKFVYAARDCPSCAGLQADRPICHVFEGALIEGGHYVTGGKDFQIAEVACRALGAPECIWEVSKTPIEK